jgi:hypothetical protein
MLSSMEEYRRDLEASNSVRAWVEESAIAGAVASGSIGLGAGLIIGSLGGLVGLPGGGCVREEETLCLSRRLKLQVYTPARLTIAHPA